MKTHYERIGGSAVIRRLVDRFGHPFLRRRHLPFAVGVAERDQWMGCMIRAMQDVGVETAMQQELTAALFKTADFMRNQPE